MSDLRTQSLKKATSDVGADLLSTKESFPSSLLARLESKSAMIKQLQKLIKGL